MHDRFVSGVSKSGSHIAFLYDSPDERMELLSRYFREGIENKELCVFVTPESEEEVIVAFGKHGFNAAPAIKNGGLRIFETTETYLSDGRFVATYMLHNVAQYIEDAKKQGYTGLRTAGDMGWTAKNPDTVEETIEYERLINVLTEQSGESFIGMCLYPVPKTFGKMKEGVLTTHPSLLFNDGIQHNNQYAVS